MKTNRVSSVVKGLTAGAIVGTAAYMMTATNKRRAALGMKKSAGKAVKAMGDVIENVSCLLK